MSTDERIGLGLIGCGAFGLFCLEAFSQMPEVRVCGVADLRPDAAGRAARGHGTTAFADAGALIADPAVRLVHVATPPSTHHELALAAIAAGKHVLCEKPLALNVAQADEVLAAAGDAGVICPVNFVLRYNAVTDAVKAVLDSQVLGRVLSGRLTNCAKDSTLGPEHWFWDKAVSGGIFIEHGVHFFDLYAYWLGPGKVIHAHAEARAPGGMEDRATCTVRHDGGTIVSHYHGFDQMDLMDRTDHRLVCELGDVRVKGWIPLSMKIDAAVDEAGADRLTALCSDATIDTTEAYSHPGWRARGRGVDRAVTRRIRLEYSPCPDKPALYAASLRALLADQIARIRDAGHSPRIPDRAGRDALVFAEAATRLATCDRPDRA